MVSHRKLLSEGTFDATLFAKNLALLQFYFITVLYTKFISSLLSSNFDPF